jgi:phosphomannomutase
MKDRSLTLTDSTTKNNLNLWLHDAYDEETKSCIRRLLQNDPKEIIDAFYTHLSFGTGGLRGIMGVGTNRMNPYTVRAATQGLVNYLKNQKNIIRNYSILIGYDSRHNSRIFAEEAAKVLAANNIKVYLFSQLRPTPIVSFGCRYKECSAAIMITASHNPSQYNGYKVFWNDGSQLLPLQENEMIKEIKNIKSLSEVKVAESLEDRKITIIDDEIDDAYLNCTKEYSFYPQENKDHGKSLKIVYTSLHGTGITLVPQILKQWGFNPLFVESQIVPDGNFPTVTCPNPEDADALRLGLEALKKHEADLLIATDPDTDRVGVAINHQGKIHILSGNQIACICLQHICQALTEKKCMPVNAAFIKSIGTTELFKVITEAYGKKCVNVLTGFKYFAEKIREWEQNPPGFQFIFGGEESCGYLFGTHCRDKDAIISCALICEIALHAKRQRKSLIDLVYDLYRQHGVYVEKLFSIKFEKSSNMLMMQARKTLKNHLSTRISGIEIEAIEDYKFSTKFVCKTGKTESILLPKSDVLLFWLNDGTKLMIRPSGTESKIKIYCGVIRKTFQTIPQAIQEGEQHANTLISEVCKFFIETPSKIVF